MNKMDRYNHPLQKRQQRKQRTSDEQHDRVQKQYDALLNELRSSRTDESRMTPGRNGS